MDAKQRIARRVAQELRDGDIVNLGSVYPQWSPIIYRRVFISLCNRKTASSVLGPVTTAHQIW